MNKSITLACISIGQKCQYWLGLLNLNVIKIKQISLPIVFIRQVGLVCWCLTTLLAFTNRLYHALPPGLCGGNLLTTLRCPQRGLSSQSLNQSNQHTSTYSRIQQQRKNPYYSTIHDEYTQETPRINRQDRWKVMFTGSAYPREISQQCTPATHTEAVHCQGVLLGVFHPCL